VSEVAARHAALCAAVRAYLGGAFGALPAARGLGPRLGGALVLAVGARALDATGADEPLEVEVILAPAEWERLRAEARPQDLAVLDPTPGAAVHLSIRGEAWLRDRLAECPGLWLRQRAAVVQDPRAALEPLVRQALEGFRLRLAREVESAYRDLREGFDGADLTLDPVGRTALLGRAAAAALALPLLCRGEPYPPPRWLAWYLAQVVPDGELLAGLAARALGGRVVERQAHAALRRLVEEGLDRAGYGESLVRVYSALA